MSEQISVSVFVTPVMNVLGKENLLYNLSDMSYGEWLIYENNKPKYYFNAFDDYYLPVKRLFDSVADIESLLKSSFQTNRLTLSLHQNVYGIRRDAKAYLETYSLEKYPLEFIEIS